MDFEADYDTDVYSVLSEDEYDDFEFRVRGDDDNLTCIIPAILEFPNFMRKKNIVSPLIAFILSMYLFVFLAIVCDDYLVPSMERLCYALRMTYDVAGATFMAMATSAPELFVNFVGTFVTQGDIGVGTIVGSSVFNILAIAAVCGICTGVTSKLDWWPLTRDMIWYLISVVLLCVVLLDSYVNVYEAAGLLLVYVIYLITLIFDRRIQKCCRRVEEETELLTEDPMLREEEPLMTFREHLCGYPKESSTCAKICFVFQYPCKLILALTTPSVRTIYFLTMIVAIIWISLVSYLLTWFLTIVGYNLLIPDSIMGLTVLAAGTSVPEAVSSFIVFKKGYGSMAMCNAIGSNTFDILVCLGLPWILKILIGKKNIGIESPAMLATTTFLIITAVVLYICFLITKFVLGKVVGIMALLTYIIFLVCAIGLEIYWLKPTCDIESEEYSYLVDGSRNLLSNFF